MVENKLKSIIIDGDLHKRFKLFCRGKSLKIGAVTEDLIRLYLHKRTELQKMIDDLKDSLIK